ncbi:MAG: BCCT family transporter, partial [Defluviitaleaceae bacterium]|nr:BCCT family transporter [Defluviitaleaceae bacterium]
KLEQNKEPSRAIRVFWAVVVIIFPIGLIFSESALYNLQTVAIVAAFPIGMIVILIVVSFFKDAKSGLGDVEK